MSMMEYWPSRENIVQCIRNEAEELEDHVLLAVHEPMLLTRRDVNENHEILRDEDLFQQLLITERAIPLIGRSGMGKSHLVRWLDCRFNMYLTENGQRAQWEIVRIPKNSSLRQVLLRILKNLTGEFFDNARTRVNEVTEQYPAKDLADLLLTMMAHQLQDMQKAVMEEGKTLQAQGKDIPSDRLAYMETIIEEVENGICDLITDANFKQNLLKPEHCIFKLASRMSNGLEEGEEHHDKYELLPEDLYFVFEPDDLSARARRYLNHSQLHESDQVEARARAARVLNEAMHASLKSLFKRLFTFNGGSFQELFQEIRKEFLRLNRRLVILVEDMAAISAIEDVLIDSLIEEAAPGGVQTLCPVHSVIAVTDNYPGYKRRQETLITRAGYEWIIENVDKDNNKDRIVSLCGRYLNAARFGSEELKNRPEQGKPQWPPVWHSDDIPNALEDFGYSANKKFPLFPYNRSAILALANKHCRDSSGELIFNPRTIINRILLDILRDCRTEAEKTQFPPTHLAGINAVPEIEDKISQMVVNRVGSSVTLAAIWGYGIDSFDELCGKLPGSVASAFGLDELSAQLTGKNPTTEPVTKTAREMAGKTGSTAAGKKLDDPELKPKEEAKSNTKSELPFIRAVRAWVNDNVILPQDVARDLRAALNACYEIHAQPELFGMSSRPPLKEGRFTLISLPKAASDPSSIITNFYSEQDLTDPSRRVDVYNAAVTLLRIQHYTGLKQGFNYPEAQEDYTRYQNFIQWWVPQATESAINHFRARNLRDALKKHLQKALLLGLVTGKEEPAEIVNTLCLTQKGVGRTEEKNIGRTLATSPSEICFRGIEATLHPHASARVAEARVQALLGWDDARKAWLEQVAITEQGSGLGSSRAIDADVIFSALKTVLKQPLGAEIERAALSVKQELASTLNNVQLFANIKDSDDFLSQLNDWQTFIETVRAEHYPTGGSQYKPSSWLLGEIEALRTDTEESLATLISLLSIEKEKDSARLWLEICQLDGDYVSRISSVLAQWQLVQPKIAFALQQMNAKGDIQQLTLALSRVNDRLKTLASDIIASGVDQ
ncbi:protein DpdH [Serratia marcescens]|uniref:protein DpdH n=1 Tax=Serratia marcescens TaxID=615 RepID=UPI00235F98FE|nr:protein DpdH [Serratia marcescens]